eukprot:g62872.t1
MIRFNIRVESRTYYTNRKTRGLFYLTKVRSTLERWLVTMTEVGLAQQLVTSLFQPGVSQETFTILKTTLVTLLSLGIILLIAWGVDWHIILLMCFALGLFVTVVWYVNLAGDAISSFTLDSAQSGKDTNTRKQSRVADQNSKQKNARKRTKKLAGRKRSEEEDQQQQERDNNLEQQEETRGSDIHEQHNQQKTESVENRKKQSLQQQSSSQGPRKQSSSAKKLSKASKPAQIKQPSSRR